MRRLGARARFGAVLTGVAFVTMGASMFGAGRAAAQTDHGAGADRAASSAQETGCPNGCVRVYDVAGLIDPVVVAFLEQGITEAETTPGTVGVVLELNSDGVVVSDDDLARLARRLRRSTVPVSAWIGPSGATARGGAAELVAILDHSSIAPGSTIGDVGSQRLPVEEFGHLFDGKASALHTSTVGATRAVSSGVVDRQAPTAGDHLVGLDGVESKVVKGKGGELRRQPVTRAVIAKLPLLDQLFHTVASPAVAYLLLGVGIGLLIFEFFTAGVGVAGVIGAGSLLLASYGLGVLPVRTWAVVVLGLAGVAFAIDVQTGVPRAWTFIGMTAWIVGSAFLFDGVHLPWLALITGLVGMGVAMISGMPAMVRSRFGTPTVDRDFLVGADGTAITTVRSGGTVTVDGALWPARSAGSRISSGTEVTVTAADGAVLEVEPSTAGASAGQR